MVCPTATRAGNFKPRPTILAEDGIGGIFSPAFRAVHIITQLALKSFKLLGREKRCRTEQSVPTVGGFADTKANSVINVGRVTGNSLRFGALSELRVDLPG